MQCAKRVCRTVLNCALQVVRLVVGNKSDMDDKRQVPTEVAEKWCKAQGHTFFETSAKQSTNVEQAFIFLVKEITRRRNLKVRWRVWTQCVWSVDMVFFFLFLVA